MLLLRNKVMKILLSEIMYSKNISVRQLSVRSGISKSTIDNIMNEVYSPTMENMELLAKALKVRITDLFESDYK
jgi:transcriptional regulator with XRE-family HTH domain|nr:MAG TPA: helix-turn-helix domain protein [Caudoviricetes sp.]DAZ27700.1 MAG TPA: helix-turn-helix domain protein [Caudoviricetes sp.]